MKRLAIAFLILLAFAFAVPLSRKPQSAARVSVSIVATLEGYSSDSTRTKIDMAVGDVDGDGKADIVLDVPFGHIHVIGWDDASQQLVQKDSFQVRTGTHHLAVEVGDVDNDGKNEIVVGNNYDDIYFYKYNSSGGTFYELHSYRLTNIGGDVRSLLVGDFDGDSNPDVAVLINGTAYANRTLLIYENAGSGFSLVFNASPILRFNGTSSATPDNVAAGDVDGDGNIEIAVVGYNGSGNQNFVILQNTGDDAYAFETGYTFSRTPKSVTVADADGDGNKEFAMISLHYKVYFMEATGANTYSNWEYDTGEYYLLYTYGGHNHEIAFYGDADDNGVNELVIAQEYSSGSILEAVGDNTITNRTGIRAPEIPSSYSYSNAKVAIADVWGGDGKEIIIAGPNHDKSSVGINIYAFPDTTAPAISITAAPSGSYTESDDIVVNATITDAGANASGVNYSAVFVKWNSTPDDYHYVPMAHVSGNNYSVNLKGKVSVGLIDYSVVAKDLAGNENEVDGGSFTVVDTLPPSINEVTAEASVEYGTEFNVTANVTDASLQTVLLIYNTGGGNITKAMIQTDGLFYSTIPGQAYGTAVHVWIYANDSVGHESTSNEVTINVVDTVPPAISGLSYTPVNPVAGDKITVSVTVSEDALASGVKSVTLKYRINGGPWNEVTMSASGDQYVAQIGGFSGGDIVDMKVVAEDHAGNTAESSLVSVTIGGGGGAGLSVFGIPIEYIVILVGVLAAAVIVIIALRKRGGGGGGESGSDEFF